jgi:hypothetical protein
MTKRRPRVTERLLNAIRAAREHIELAYRFVPNSYTYSAFLAAMRAEALLAEKKRGRRKGGHVPDSTTHGVDHRPPLSRRPSGTSRSG